MLLLEGAEDEEGGGEGGEAEGVAGEVDVGEGGGVGGGHHLTLLQDPAGVQVLQQGGRRKHGRQGCHQRFWIYPLLNKNYSKNVKFY